MSRSGSALPPIFPEKFERLQREREKDPDYIRKLLEEAQAEFDEKWGIDPNSPTDYDGHPGTSV